MTLDDQQRSDTDEVLTSAPPLPITARADLEETWTGDDGALGRTRAALAAVDRIGWGHDEECPHRYCAGDVGECSPCGLQSEEPCACSSYRVLELAAAAGALAEEHAAIEARLAGAQERAAMLERTVDNERARADAAERDARVHREGHHGALAGLEEAKARNAALELDVAHWKAGALGFESQIEALEAELSAERERAAAQTRLYESALSGIGIIRDGRLHEGLEVFVDACAHAKAAGTAPDLMVSFFVTTCPVAFEFAGLLARIARRSHEIRATIPAAAVLVCRDDAGDHARQDVPERLGGSFRP